MRPGLNLLYFILLFSLNCLAQNPFTIRIDRVNTTIPGFHSGAVGHSGNYLVMIGGRTNGLHGFSSNDGFDRQYANNRVIVIDTSTWQSYTASLSQLPLSVADPLRSTNMQHVQLGTKLYMCGGFGWDSLQNKFVTFPVLSVIHVDSLINAVLTSTPIASSIRQITDTIVRTCGGELRTIDSTFYLFGGHNFNGRYTDPATSLFTQRYLRTLRKFSIEDNGTSISIQNYSEVTDSAAFHRRDMNVAPQRLPGNKNGHVILGGVFTADNLPYLNPVMVDKIGHTISPLTQKMNQYTAAVITLFDTLLDVNYHIIPGGISLYEFDQATNSYIQDQLSPFVNEISILSFPHSNSPSEYVSTTGMPDYLGSNMVFIPAANTSRFDNDIIKLVPNTSLFAGYLTGGIRASGPNFMPSTVNDSIYKVYLQYMPSSIEELSMKKLSVYPNPAKNEVNVEAQANNGPLEFYDSSSRLVMMIDKEKLKTGQNRIDVSMLQPGYYVIRQQNYSAQVIISR